MLRTVLRHGITRTQIKYLYVLRYSDTLRLRGQEERTVRANESHLYLQQLGMYLSRDFFL